MDELRRHNVQVFSSNYALYADMSNRVMTTLEDMAPAVEIYSIDEAFMNLTGIRRYKALEDYGREIRERIYRETHLTVGVGIALQKNGAKRAEW